MVLGRASSPETNLTCENTQTASLSITEQVSQRRLKEAESRHVGDSPEEKTVLKTSERLAETTNEQAAEPQGAEPTRATSTEHLTKQVASAAVPLPPVVEDDFVPDDPRDSVHPDVESGQDLTSSRVTQEAETTGKQTEEKRKAKAKKKKPKLLNKFDKTIKTEIDSAEKLRKKGKLEEALRAFESLVQQFPQSPRARYGKAQTEDDLAEKLRSNDMLQRAINTYRDAAELPDVTSDLLRAALKRRAERQQFLGRMRGSLATLERLCQIFPEDVGLKNDLGVAYLLLGDNKGAKKVYEEVLAVAPADGFAKVHYGFILKSENKIAESIPYLKEGLESGEPGTDDGRFYFHLGDALQRVGDSSG
ncbi:hypothetical protein L3Q82_018367 [Scortum barcoo]|uniref:Uncharacterized protein n=1 Tax=Scortum barcoo TaxID=214431 RepID=A0ACB8VLY6_9TELE|nr:hypothetical protein L3Q82_018367 [Scortum barcoo]